MAYLSRTKGKTASQARSLCCSLLLVLSCAFGLGSVSAKAESLTALQNEFMPVVVNLVVNSQTIENSVVVLRHLSGEWWLPIETLRLLRVRTTDYKQKEFNYLELKYENEYEKISNECIDKIKILLENKQDTNEWNKQKYYVNFKKLIDKNLEIKNSDMNKNKIELCAKFAGYSYATNLQINNSIIYLI